MNVLELINALESMPDEAEVWISVSSNDAPLTSVELDDEGAVVLED
jgi:hypothetical protein